MLQACIEILNFAKSTSILDEQPQDNKYFPLQIQNNLALFNSLVAMLPGPLSCLNC